MSASSVMVATPFSPMKEPGTIIDWSDYNFSMNLYEDWSNYFEILTWFNRLYFPETYEQHQQITKYELDPFEKSDVNVVIFDNMDRPKLNVFMAGAFPITLSSPTFDSTNTDPNAPFVIDASFEFQTCRILPFNATDT